MPGPARLVLTITCAYCGTTFETRSHGKQTKRFCSPACSGPGAHPAKPVEKVCLQCGSLFTFRSSGTTNNTKRRFCSNACAGTWRQHQPGLSERYHEAGAKGLATAASRRRGTKDPRASARMKANWPQRDPEVYERWKASLRGRTFLARGGNPKLTRPQMLLAERLGLPVEYVIVTRPVARKFPSLPSCYKVDLADPTRKLAIAVDGKTRRQRKWRFLDARKTEVLSALGWSVLRFTNEQVLQDTDAVIATIRSCTTSR